VVSKIDDKNLAGIIVAGTLLIFVLGIGLGYSVFSYENAHLYEENNYLTFRNANTTGMLLITS
jgi:hypothetical protein